jgi:alcohol dehydrogenase (cytochrome c)
MKMSFLKKAWSSEAREPRSDRTARRASQHGFGWGGMFLVLGAMLSGLALTPGAVAQGKGVDAQMLLHPPADSWPSYHGDYSGRRHSPLTQITPRNVHDLGLAWAFQTGQQASLKATPLLVDGILYFTVPDNLWAVDARSGHMLWHYRYPPP